MIKINAEYTPQKVHDIEDTPFYAEVNELRYYFTSFFYLDNFEKKFDERLRLLENRLLPYLPCRENTKVIGLEDLNALTLYGDIEKRGCRILNTKTKDEYRWLEEIKIEVQYLVE